METTSNGSLIGLFIHLSNSLSSLSIDSSNGKFKTQSNDASLICKFLSLKRVNHMFVFFRVSDELMFIPKWTSHYRLI